MLGRRDRLHVWPVFTDLMSGIALMLLLLGLRETHKADRERREAAARLQQVEERVRTLQTELDEEHKKFGVKREIVERIRQELERQSIKVTINKLGNLEISAELLFASNQSEIPYALRPNAQSIGLALVRLFDDRKTDGSISMLMVIGHTDQDGPANGNLELSTKRAVHLVELWQRALFSDSETVQAQQCISAKFVAVGMGESHPLVRDEQVGGKPGGECGNLPGEWGGCRRNRRIEIRVIPKDERASEMEGCR